MNRLQIELIIRLDLHEAHVLALDCFDDPFGIDKIVLVRLHEKLHKLSRDRPDILPLLPQRGTEEESAGRSTGEGRMFAINVRSCFYVNCFRSSTLPAALGATR